MRKAAEVRQREAEFLQEAPSSGQAAQPRWVLRRLRQDARVEDAVAARSEQDMLAGTEPQLPLSTLLTLPPIGRAEVAGPN